MELAERRRSRKSQSFKLISDSDYGHNPDTVEYMDMDSKPLDASENETWLGEEGMEIKKQITGMMRLLSDKAGRVYQRVGREGETLKEEPQEDGLNCTSSHKQGPEEPEHGWNSVSHSQYDTRSKTQKMQMDQSKIRDSALPHVPASMTTESSCCTCNCKSTLHAILLELRTMRKLMQTQRGPPEKQHGVARASPTNSKRSPKRRTEREQKERTVPSPPSTPVSNPISSAQYCLNTDTELKVQLAEEYEVFIPKAKLDFILLNYTRSGRELFRKLVRALFDDATLANSLPIGYRK